MFSLTSFLGWERGSPSFFFLEVPPKCLLIASFFTPLWLKAINQPTNWVVHVEHLLCLRDCAEDLSLSRKWEKHDPGFHEIYYPAASGVKQGISPTEKYVCYWSSYGKGTSSRIDGEKTPQEVARRLRLKHWIGVKS